MLPLMRMVSDDGQRHGLVNVGTVFASTIASECTDSIGDSYECIF